jgi:hypothetical protein
MATTHKDLRARAEALLDYLFLASTDGRGPETVLCTDDEQAQEVMNEFLTIQHLNRQPLMRVVRHHTTVTLWLTEYGHEVTRRRAEAICLPYLGT